MEVEAEIRETIEQSEKYKKNLSDSGRQEEPRLVINTAEQPVFRPVANGNNSATRSNSADFHAEQKPNLRRPAPTPQADFRRQNLSPNAAEGKERLGLKDLAKLVADQANDSEVVSAATTGNGKKGKNGSKNRRNQVKKGKKRFEKQQDTKMNSTPVVPSVNPGSNAGSTSVRPEVECQEKSTVDIHPSHNSLPLSTPVKHTEDFASKDNSVDGFLSIKH